MSKRSQCLKKKSLRKEVKRMNRVLSIVIAITMVISTSGLSLAAFDSIGKEQYTANSGVISGTPGVTVDFSASLLNIANDASATSVSWSAITSGTTGWLAANQYIAVQGFATYSDWGIQIYTNNTSYTGTGQPAGLINVANPIYSLPMAWRTKTEKLATGSVELEIVQKTVGGYQVLADGTTPAITYYPWFFMLDKNGDVDSITPGTQPFGNYQAEATFIGSAGYHHAPGPVNYATPTATDTTYYVYLGANFSMAMPGAAYATDADSLTVEMYRL
jgi:hypothetical protein